MAYKLCHPQTAGKIRKLHESGASDMEIAEKTGQTMEVIKAVIDGGVRFMNISRNRKRSRFLKLNHSVRTPGRVLPNRKQSW